MLFEDILTILNQSQYTQAQPPQNREYGVEYTYYIDYNKYVEITTTNHQHIIKKTDLIILTQKLIIFSATDIYPINTIKEIKILTSEKTSEGNSTNKNTNMDFTILDQITKKLDIESNFVYIPEGVTVIETVPSVQGMIRKTKRQDIIYFDIMYTLNGINAPYHVYWVHTLIIQTNKMETITVEELLHHHDVGVMVDAYLIQNIEGLFGGEAPLFTDLIKTIYTEKPVKKTE